MEENNQEIVDQTVETTEESTETQKPMSMDDDGVIRVNLDELNKPQEEEVIAEEPVAEEEDTVNEQPVAEETIVEDTVDEAPVSLLEEITDEESIQEEATKLEDEVEAAVEEAKKTGKELPENIEKLVQFMEETGGDLKDYVRLNTDYSELDDNQLIREYYESTNPNLDEEDIEFLLEDKFSYDEDLDDEREIKLKKLEKKQALAKAKDHLESLKQKYYTELKAGSKLNPEQKKAVEFFDRYNKEQEELTKITEKQKQTFTNKTEKLFSNDFKGFDFNVGEKKFRFKVNDVETVKTQQSDINNFVKKFLNNNNEIEDAAGYHKSLFTAMNPDAIANHFYEQGKADALKSSVAKAKNVDMTPRGTHQQVVASNGWTIKSVSPGTNSSKLKIRK